VTIVGSGTVSEPRNTGISGIEERPDAGSTRKGIWLKSAFEKQSVLGELHKNIT
jgi:hypothetical protein